MYKFNKKRIFCSLFFFSFCISCCKNSYKNKNNKYICYTSGTFDMFHVGHVKLLEKAKGICNILIVGVHPDDVIFKNKNKYPIIPFEQRIEIVRTNKYVDVAVEDKEYTYSKNLINKYKINMFIIGDDYFGKWDKIEKELEENGAKLIYLPYTKSQSSTEIRQKLKDK